MMSGMRLLLIVFASGTLAFGIHAPVAEALDRQPQTAPPQINIDDQVILLGETFDDIVLADALANPDYPAEQLTWTVSGSTELSVQMIDGVVAVTAPENWTGSETVHFEAAIRRQCAVAMTPFSGVMEDANEPVTVTFVGNSGFLITVGDTKILIDGLFEGFPGYALPDDELQQLLGAEPPFDHLDLILRTHDHGDHFSARMVCQHLKNDPEAVFVSTEAAADAVIAAGCPATSIALQRGGTCADGRERHWTASDVSLAWMFGNLSEPGIYRYGGRTAHLPFRRCRQQSCHRQLSPVKRRVGSPSRSGLYCAFLPSSVHSPVVEALLPATIFPIHYVYTQPPMNPELISFCYPDAVIFSHEMETWIMP